MNTFGDHNAYSWIEWNDRGAFLSNLIKSFPELVVGKYLINTSFDSGPLSLSEEEVSNGWVRVNGATLSPVIKSTDEIPGNGFDEWYVFPQRSRFDSYEVFVNYGGFSLHLPSYRELANRFWEQISRIEPETFLAEGDNLICVTQDRSIAERLKRWSDHEDS